MTQSAQRATTVAIIANPAADKGRGRRVGEQVFNLFVDAGQRHGFEVIDLTGDGFESSLDNAREHADAYDHLVVVGGDGMISLGANAVANSGKSLGIVAMGSGNDFARGLRLPVNRIETAVEGIVGAVMQGSHIDVDMGYVRSIEGSDIDRYYAGMLSCGIDASVNDRANHSHLPNGTLRYLAAVLVEVAHLKRYGYHVKATLADGSIEERDLITPLLTVANSRHIGGGIMVSPYSQFADGLLDMVWLDRMPGVAEIAKAMRNAYNGRILATDLFGWQRIRAVEIARSDEGARPPVLMADGEYLGELPVSVSACGKALRVLVPPAVARVQRLQTSEQMEQEIRRDGRDPMTGRFVG